MKITKDIAQRVLDVVDAGLCWGLGEPVPGNMCVEAAVCYALGEDFGDRPTCVSRAVREFKIRLNDSLWSSKMQRAKGMRRLAIAQLGSAGVIGDIEFVQSLVPLARKWAVAVADADAAYAADVAAADVAAAYAAYAADVAAAIYDAADAAADAAAYAAAAAVAAARDKFLSDAAEDVVQVLIRLKSPGAEWLSLTE